MSVAVNLPIFRQLKQVQLQRKDAKQVELEEKERGFTLYFHGANKEPGKKTYQSKVPRTAASKSRKF